MPSKIIFSLEDEKKICELYNSNLSVDKIAYLYKRNSSTIRRVLVSNNIKIKNLHERSVAIQYNLDLTRKKCTKCNVEQNVNYFNIKDNGYHDSWCFICRKLEESKSAKKYNKKNKEKLNKASRDYAKNNREKIRYSKNLYYKKPENRVHISISATINEHIRSNGGNKNYKSIFDFLPYTKSDLKNHIENLFEPWMNWNNRGHYKVGLWNDNDLLTWKWQLDHIIPHSDLPYNSMEEDNFKKCWALSNLRPYSAKQNLLDGVTRVRHVSR